MKQERVLHDENDVKAILLSWWQCRPSWHYAPVQFGLGVHGIHDRLGGVAIVVTPEMVGKTILQVVSTEAKKPGRRGEKNRGMSKHQFDHMNAINAVGGISLCVDGYDDLRILDQRLEQLIHGPR